MINHPSAGIATREVHRQELFALAARERQARIALLGATSNAASEPCRTRWTRFSARLPLAIRPVRRDAALAADPSWTGGGPFGRLRLLARNMTPCLAAFLVLLSSVTMNLTAVEVGAPLSGSARWVAPND